MPPRTIGSGPSCMECRRCKIKCERSVPCSYCITTGIECIFPSPSIRAPRNQNSVAGDNPERVETIERALRLSESGSSHLQAVPSPSTPCSAQSDDPVSELAQTEQYGPHDLPAGKVDLRQSPLVSPGIANPALGTSCGDRAPRRA